jgi:hypothetical protein
LPTEEFVTDVLDYLFSRPVHDPSVVPTAPSIPSPQRHSAAASAPVQTCATSLSELSSVNATETSYLKHEVAPRHRERRLDIGLQFFRVVAAPLLRRIELTRKQRGLPTDHHHSAPASSHGAHRYLPPPPLGSWPTATDIILVFWTWFPLAARELMTTTITTTSAEDYTNRSKSKSIRKGDCRLFRDAVNDVHVAGKDEGADRSDLHLFSQSGFCGPVLAPTPVREKDMSMQVLFFPPGRSHPERASSGYVNQGRGGSVRSTSASRCHEERF